MHDTGEVIMTEPPVWQNQGYLKLTVQQWCAFLQDPSIFLKSSRRSPLKKGAATENPLEYGQTEVQILFEPLRRFH